MFNVGFIRVTWQKGKTVLKAPTGKTMSWGGGGWIHRKPGISLFTQQTVQMWAWGRKKVRLTKK